MCHQLPRVLCRSDFSRGDGADQRIGEGGLGEGPGKTALLSEKPMHAMRTIKYGRNKVVDPNTEYNESWALNDDAS